MNWPNKAQRENYEINGFIEAYSRLPESRKFEIVLKGDKPDYILKDAKTGDEYGVEVTSVYQNDRSVPDAHMRDKRGDSSRYPLTKMSWKGMVKDLSQPLLLKYARPGEVMILIARSYYPFM